MCFVYVGKSGKYLKVFEVSSHCGKQYGYSFVELNDATVFLQGELDRYKFKDGTPFNELSGVTINAKVERKVYLLGEYD